MAEAPSSTAFETATTMPRSLNEPVGLVPSTLAYRLRSPSSAPSRPSRTSGVSSLRLIRGRVGDRQEVAVALDQAWARGSVIDDGSAVVISSAAGSRRRRRASASVTAFVRRQSPPRTTPKPLPRGPRAAGRPDRRHEGVPVASGIEPVDRGDGGCPAGGRPAHVDGCPRATANRSPSTLSRPRRLVRQAGRSERLGIDLDPVGHAVRPAERAVGRHRGREDRGDDPGVRPRRRGEQLDGQPQRAGPLDLLVGHAGDPRPARAPSRRRRTRDRARLSPRRTQGGRGSRAC